MKKVFLAASVVALCLTSCTTVRKSATTIDIATKVCSPNSAELEVSEKRVTYKFYPEKRVRRGGLNNIKNTAVREALAENGDGDVLVDAKFDVTPRRGLMGTKVKSVIVTGYPAKYKNFKTGKEAGCHK